MWSICKFHRLNCAGKLASLRYSLKKTSILKMNELKTIWNQFGSFNFYNNNGECEYKLNFSRALIYVYNKRKGTTTKVQPW